MTHFNCNFNNTLPYSDKNAQLLLAANTVLTFTVPGIASQQYRAYFRASSTAEILVGYNATPALPSAGAATTVANVEFLPWSGECRYVKGGDVLSFLSATTPLVGVALLETQKT